MTIRGNPPADFLRRPGKIFDKCRYLWSALLLTLLLISPVQPQSDSTAAQNDDPQMFAAVFVKPGLPEVGIDLESFPYFDRDSSAYAPIYGGDIFPSVYLIFPGKAIAGKRMWFMVSHEEANTFGISTIPVEADTTGMMIASKEVHAGETGQLTLKLELRYIPTHRLLLYRWPNASPEHPGGIPSTEGMKEPMPIGGLMPELWVTDLKGDTLWLNRFPGKIVVVNWWAMFCSPCIEEMPGLNKLVEKYRDKGVEFIAIARNTAEELQDFFTSHRFLYRQTLANEQAAQLMGNVFPRHVIIDQEGRIAFNQSGGSQDKAQELEAVIVRLLEGR
ncbi:MAG: TlpA family protein disulfide reductase [Calditrichaeota bacterium]|nr:MAG: TlpA family protein disulfide reductase [Calditrichota bacterium]